MFISELFFVFSETEKTDFAHRLFDPEMLFPEAGKMDFITFWEQLLGINSTGYIHVRHFGNMKKSQRS